ncbi:ATP-binding protein [Streptomyces sp. SDT5-1]|uniref:ATP-binding protein n=1 Tax=Streptomyces sp. SDT5-1 TaxID=3406418 RepID=UPI003FD3D4C2
MTYAPAVTVLDAVPLQHAPRRAFEVAFQPDTSRVSHARRITAAFLAFWQVPERLAEDIVLIVSELVANAINHGASASPAPGHVSLRLQLPDDEIRIEVIDSNPAPATMQSPSDEEESGRGLLLVSALADKWGVTEDGTKTWCTVNIPARSA